MGAAIYTPNVPKHTPVWALHGTHPAGLWWERNELTLLVLAHQLAQEMLIIIINM